MAEGISTKQLVIIALCVLAIIAGTFLLIRTTSIKEVVQLLPVPFTGDKSFLEITPESSQQGTIFIIKTLNSENKEGQDNRIIIQNGNYSEELMLYDDGRHYDGKPSDGIYGGFFDSSGKPLGKYELANEKEVLGSLTTYRAGCKPLEGTPGDSTINFVFVPEGYDDIAEFEKDTLKILESSESLLNAEPFKSNKNRFSFTIVDSQQKLGCEVGCKDVQTLVCCNNQRVIEQASQCTNDQVIVLLNNADLYGSASSYAKICAKSSLADMVFMHEIGHSFAGLADEYTYASEFGNYSIGEINAPNCDTKGCSKWSNITTGCFKGCTYSDLYRSEKTQSIMYDYVPIYNAVSQLQILKMIEQYSKKESSATSVQSPAKKSYFVNMRYNQGKIEIENLYIKPINAPRQPIETGYSAEIKDSKGKIISGTFLRIPLEIFPLPGSNSTAIIEDNVQFSAVLSFVPEANTLEIKKDNETLATTSVASLSAACGNKVCSEGENHISCPKDCTIKDKLCQTSSCDPDCPSQENCEQSNLLKVIGSMVIISLALITILILFLKNLKK